MITHDQLDQTIANFEHDPKIVDAAFEALENSHQLLIDILAGTHATLLTDDEMDYCLFLFAIIYHTVSKYRALPELDEAYIVKVEESVWEFINDHKDFETCIDHYLNQSEEKDLYEFIELSIGPSDDQDIAISDTGRIIMLAILVAEVKCLLETN
ncbi:MAG: hypothetical protein IPO85_04270 [Saprospiraceae bacterium]|uniref:Uncharacterized protein n=1 Tax=Candidatus Defluviibacterium haderslevense TaxID=2981993 RepID=A0A9D7XDJ2_9BACT|nr:hypothetical protein [Candidatus Defluviibacterium haderslevense]